MPKEKQSTKKRDIILKGNYNITTPNQMVQMANVLKGHIVKQQLYTNIKGKNYVHIEGWQFAGGLMGMFPKIKKVENLSTDKEKKWFAEVEIIRLKDDKVIGFGAAICSDKEYKKKSFDEYALLSMAQTRAIGKAYRNIIGWVMKLAGYEGTPKEEMKEHINTERKTKENPEQLFVKAKEMIKNTNNIEGLIDYSEKLKAGKTFSKAQKDELRNIINSKVDELQK